MARCTHQECDRWRPTVLARHGRSGMWLDSGWYCSSRCLERSAGDRLHALQAVRQAGLRTTPAPFRIGVLLRHYGGLSEYVIQMALETQRESGNRLGVEIHRLGLVTRETVVKALAHQSGVGYLSHLEPRQVGTVLAGLSRDAVRTLGMVPFEANETARQLKVVCGAPVSRLALAGLAEMTGWSTEPFVVADDELPLIIDAYGAAVGSGVPPKVTVQDVGEAAARIAHAAQDDRVVRMVPTWCDRYVWIRLERPRGVEHLLVPA